MAEHRLVGVSKYLSFVSNRLTETALWTFAELEIADLFVAADKPQTADEIAQKQGWNAEYLYRLLRCVANADIVRGIKSNETNEPEKTTRFELTENGRFLTSNHPSNCRYLICWELSPLMKTASHYLPQLIREGPSGGNGIQRSNDNLELFDFLKKKENQPISQTFNKAMTSYSTYTSEPVVNTIDFNRFNKIVDIGGGFGFLLSYILEKYLSIKQGICFDLPTGIPLPGNENEFEKRKIPKDRYQFVAGDMFDPKTIPQADAYIMKSVIHDWNDERSIDIFKSIRTAANGQQITLFIADLIILSETEQDKFNSHVTYAIDLHMMIVAGAKERTQKQYEYLLEQSGFRFKQLHRTDYPISVIEAVTN